MGRWWTESPPDANSVSAGSSTFNRIESLSYSSSMRWWASLASFSCSIRRCLAARWRVEIRGGRQNFRALQSRAGNQPRGPRRRTIHGQMEYQTVRLPMCSILSVNFFNHLVNYLPVNSRNVNCLAVSLILLGRPCTGPAQQLRRRRAGVA